MKRSIWVPLVATGVALAGIAASAMAVLKKQKKAAKPVEEPAEGEDVIEIPVTEECCDAAEAPAETCAEASAEPAAQDDTPAEE